jgi:hypothetical protein
MIEIPLTCGLFAKIDEADAYLVAGSNWRSFKGRRDKTTYARGSSHHKTILMHRIIADAPNGSDVDHIDGDGLNNCRSNLRICARTENTKNRRPNAGRRYKGVTRLHSGAWRARIKANYKDIYIGDFKSETEAAVAYNFAALVYHGDYARLNVIDYGVPS